MKKTILTLVIAIAAVVIAQAQQISVVSPQGATQVYADLNLAIKNAAAGSIVYLSGGSFQLNDTAKVTKKLTIIGVGHRTDTENADGATMVAGNFFFNKGADNSTLMGIHLTGNVNIANGDGEVNTILVRFCNVNSIQIGHSNCKNIQINQNYIRNNSSGGNSTIHFTNNILHSIQSVNGGVIDHNVVRHAFSYALYNIANSQIKNNILLEGRYIHLGSNSIATNNMLSLSWGDNCVVVESWDDVFVGTYGGVNINDNYALKGTQGKNAASDGTDIGIYGGTGFSDTALPPGPRITSKKIADKTDTNGNLRVQIEVKVQ